MLDPHRTLRWFGCFRCTVGKAADPPYWPERRDDVAEIHIQNHVTPDSPFSDRRRLAAWMLELAADVEAKAPHVTRIGTGSWLNASRHFLQVYPPAYAASLVRLSGERKSGLGTWGQFITRDLRLNAAARAAPARGADLRLPAGIRQLLLRRLPPPYGDRRPSGRPVRPSWADRYNASVRG